MTGAALRPGLIISRYRGKTLLNTPTVPCGEASLLNLCEHQVPVRLILLDDSFFRLGAYHYSAEYMSEGYRSPGLSMQLSPLWHSVLWLWPLRLPGFSAVSLQHKGSLPGSTCITYGLETLLRYWAGLILLVSPLLGITDRCCLVSSVLKIIISSILSSFSGCFRKESKSRNRSQLIWF